MNPTPTIEFDIALNIMGLPHNATYWRDKLPAICAELTNQHGIIANGWVGAYIADLGAGYQFFLLFSRALDLGKPEDLAKYHEVEAKIAVVIGRHSNL